MTVFGVQANTNYIDTTVGSTSGGQIGLCSNNATNSPSPIQNVVFASVANSASTYVVTVVNAAFGQASTITLPDPGRATAYLTLSPSTAAASAPSMIVKTVTVTAAALATAGKVNVMVHPSATSQFGVHSMRVLKSTGLSGGGGDRLLSLSDSTIVFNGTGVTAALLGTPITTRPAGTGNPDCATSVDPTASTAGADIFLQYTGGTTDFTTGSMKVEITLYQVTA